jgi:hypothetical protein
MKGLGLWLGRAFRLVSKGYIETRSSVKLVWKPEARDKKFEHRKSLDEHRYDLQQQPIFFFGL